ncbi:MAG: patatin-like phospholipase family protein [Magnetococcales bacterium]|nr:patatin-like phospholipase family protein [Magnetococcales bacterium]
MTMETINAMVFQGGGAFGAYEYGAFKALWDQGVTPNIVTGVSIGAVNAAVVAGCRNNDPPAALDALWSRISAVPMPGLPQGLHHLLSLSFNPGMYYTNPGLFFSPLTQTHFAVTTLLENTLNDLVDWDKLNDGPMRLAVTATNVETGLLEVFANYDGAAATGDGPSKRRRISALHILASGALPPGFPMVEIDHQFYWDGGLFDNTPLKPAFRALNGYQDTSDKQYRRSVYVFSLFPHRGVVPKNMLEVNDRKMSISFESKIDFDRKMYEKINSFREFAQKMDQSLPTDSPLREDPGFKDLLSYQPVPPPVFIELTEKYSLRELALVPGTDFTRETILKRSETGYRIARETLDKVGQSLGG